MLFHIITKYFFFIFEIIDTENIQNNIVLSEDDLGISKFSEGKT